MDVKQGKHRLKHSAANVFEIHVDAFYTGLCKLLGETSSTMIDTGIKAELFNGIATFFNTAGNADHATSLDFSDLSYDRTDRTGSSSDHDRFARLRLTDVKQTGISSEAWHAEQAQCGGRMRHIRCELGDTAAIRKRIVLPAGIGHHQIAGLILRMLRAHHARDRTASHDTINLDWRGIRRCIAHTAAHVRV